MYKYFNYSNDNNCNYKPRYNDIFNNVDQAIQTVLSSSIFGNKKKNSKCGTTNFCGSSKIEIQEKILDIAQTNLQAQKLSNTLEEKLTQSKTIFKQRIPEYIPTQEKENKRKQYWKDYNKTQHDKKFSELEIKKRLAEFKPIKADVKEDEDRTIEYCSYTYGLREYYWPNEKEWIKKLDGKMIPQDHFKNLFYPGRDENGKKIRIYRHERINDSYILLY